MCDAIKKAYRYYFYRMYLFYFKKWNNNKKIALFVADISMASSFMFNFGTIVILLNVFLNVWILPDYRTHKFEMILAVLLIGAFYITFNTIFLINKLPEIIDEFKNEDKNAFKTRGWIVGAYDICSFLLFAGIVLATV